MKIKILLFVAVILTVLFFSAGTAVADPEDLDIIYVDQEYIEQYLDAENPSGFEDMDGNYVLTEDIDLAGHVWKPIGSESDFSGTFDGAGRFIFGFNYDGGDQSSGFFKGVNGASVSNLTFIGSVVTASDANGVGILIGTSAGTTIIENCTVIGGSVSITGTGGENAGGFVGLFEGGMPSINRSDFIGSIVNAGKNSGGLAGSAENLTVTESSVTGSICTTGEHTGGLVGFVTEIGDVSVSDSYFEGIIEAENQASGLIGYASFDSNVCISHSYSVSEILTTHADGKSGGLIGKADSLEIKIMNSFYHGEIEDDLDNGHGIPVTKEELMKYDTFTVLEDNDGTGYIQETPWNISPVKDSSKIWYISENEDYPRFFRNAPSGSDLPGVDIPDIDIPDAAETTRSGSTGSAKIVESFSSENEEVFKPPFALDLAMEPLSYKSLYLILIVGFILIVAGVSHRLDRKY